MKNQDDVLRGSEPAGSTCPPSTPKRRRNPNSGIVLSLHDAAALARWMEFVLLDKKFFNPLEAHEAEQAASEATFNLCQKLISVYEAHNCDDEA